MRYRMLYGWNIRRVIYLVVGIIVIVYAINTQDWWPAIFGAYFAAMGLLGFGCAAGNCSTGFYQAKRKSDTNNTENTSYEEIKSE